MIDVEQLKKCCVEADRLFDLMNKEKRNSSFGGVYVPDGVVYQLVTNPLCKQLADYIILQESALMAVEHELKEKCLYFKHARRIDYYENKEYQQRTEKELQSSERELQNLANELVIAAKEKHILTKAIELMAQTLCFKENHAFGLLPVEVQEALIKNEIEWAIKKTEG